ncbi:Arginine deiminase type II [Fusarium acuminatum]|uniref:Arginine deiminase type II n=1 Tax=Fusarium acuminatum TaxID=5515 RepID=A0ABZ2WXR5_9HYPO
MHLSGAKSAVFALALFNSCNALKVTILADTNRDGKVDNNDVAGKSSWTAGKGAVFLANIGDTGGRCAKQWGPSGNIFDADESYLDKCNDAVDNVQRNPAYLAPIKTLPVTGLSASAKGSIQVTDKVAASKVRVFVKKSNKWVYVPADYAFTAKELASGLELGIDARDVRRPQGWNGNAKIQFTVTDGKAKATDAVAVRVAPVLTHHHGQLAQRIFSTGVNEPGTNNEQERYLDDLKRNVASSGIKEPIFYFDNQDIWTQDFFEAGYSSMPGPNGPVSIRIMIRSVQSSRRSGRDAFHELRSDKVGAVQHPGNGDTIDSTGNLETIPPYTHNGKSYPAGRAIMGAWDGRKPLMVEFLKAQEVQDPLILDTTWLYVGHVDEFIQFLPAHNKRGWVIMVADPIKGLALMHKAAKDGHGKVKAVSRSRSPEEAKDSYLCLPRQTIEEALKFDRFDEINKKAAQRIEANLDILKRETGITNEDIHRVPSLFYFANGNSWLCPGQKPSSSAEEESSQAPQKASSSTGISFKNPEQGSASKSTNGGPIFKAKSIVEAATPKNSLHRREVDTASQVTALYPGSVNGLVMTDSKVLVPNPWGPVIGSKDIFATAVSQVYASVGYNVTFQDDWFSHFRGQGDVHCGSNSWRAIDTKLPHY